MSFELFPFPDTRAKKLYIAPEPVPYSTYNFVKTGGVPKIFHQIWIKCGESDTKPIPEHIHAWSEYCHSHGYGYKLWTEKDHETIKTLLTQDGTYDTYMEMMKYGCYKSMSDILRYSLLYHEGGIYLDCDFPCYLSEPIDSYFFLYNMTLMTERYCRNVNQNSAHFFHTSIMISNPGHPIMERIIKSIPRNVEQTKVNAEWIMTGPMLVNRCVYGVIHIVPFNYTWLNHPYDSGDQTGDPWVPIWES